MLFVLIGAVSTDERSVISALAAGHLVSENGPGAPGRCSNLEIMSSIAFAELHNFHECHDQV